MKIKLRVKLVKMNMILCKVDLLRGMKFYKKGDNLIMKTKYGAYSNFTIVNSDFETYDFGNQRFDLIYSAATIQWIPENIAFSKVYNLLRPGGILAMFMTCSDEKSRNEELYNKIQEVYKEHFIVKQRYN